MPDLHDPDSYHDPLERAGANSGGIAGAIPGGRLRIVVGTVGLLVALVGLLYGLATGFDGDTALFTLAGLAVFLTLALTCLLELLMARHQRWPSRAFLGSVFGLSLLRLLGID